MNDKLRVLRNSFFLIGQPLVLNVLSIFSTAYISRKLGVEDFGIFNLTVTFTMMFFPIAVLGLNRVMIRDMAALEDKQAYVNQIMGLRMALILLAVLGIALGAKLMGYPQRTMQAIWLGCVLFAVKMLEQIYHDIFHAHERMDISAIGGMIAGITLTVLSVIAVYLGFGLFAVIGTYAIGQFVGLLICSLLLSIKFFHIKFGCNRNFSISKVKEAFPFFLMTGMWYLMSSLDTICLSKNVGLIQMGFYTSAILLVSKLTIIPQGLSSAILPAISRLHRLGKHESIQELVRMVFELLAIFVLPIIIFVASYADKIVTLMFGQAFKESGPILAVAIWAFGLRCLSFIQFSILVGSRQQQKLLLTYIVATIYCVITNLILPKWFGINGALFVYITTPAIMAICFTWFTFEELGSFIRISFVVRCLLVNTILAAIIVKFNYLSLFVLLPFVLIGYTIMVFLFGLLKLSSINAIKQMIRSP